MESEQVHASPRSFKELLEHGPGPARKPHLLPGHELSSGGLSQ